MYRVSLFIRLRPCGISFDRIHDRMERTHVARGSLPKRIQYITSRVEVLMEQPDRLTEGLKPESEAAAKTELVDEDLEQVAGGGTSCTPDDPTTTLPDDFFIPLNPIR